MLWIRLTVLIMAIGLFAPSARAQIPQSHSPLDLLTDLYRQAVDQALVNFDSRDNAPVAPAPGVAFKPRIVFEGTDIRAVLVSSVVTDIFTFPLGSSSGGFIYTTEPGSLGLEPVRMSESFGPAFAERAQTIGRDRASFGTTFMHRRYDSLEGKRLPLGELRVGAELKDSGAEDLAAELEGTPSEPFDVLVTAFTVQLDSYVTTFFGAYGVTDNVDVAVAVPFQQIDMDASVTSSTTRGSALVAPATAVGSAHASGLGDIAIRSKVKLFDTAVSAGRGSNPPRFGATVAAGFDLRVPTGDELQMLGTGLTRLKLYGAGSFKIGRRLLPHLNVGYTFPSGSPDSDLFTFGTETSIAAGAEGVLSDRLTLVGDVLGRRLADEGRLHESLMLLNGTSGPFLALNEDETLNVWLGTVGFKFNPRSTFIISGHLLFPLNDQGLQSRMSVVIGADYTFGTGRIHGPRDSRR